MSVNCHDPSRGHAGCTLQSWLAFAEHVVPSMGAIRKLKCFERSRRSMLCFQTSKQGMATLTSGYHKWGSNPTCSVGKHHHCLISLENKQTQNKQTSAISCFHTALTACRINNLKLRYACRPLPRHAATLEAHTPYTHSKNTVHKENTHTHTRTHSLSQRRRPLWSCLVPHISAHTSL